MPYFDRSAWYWYVAGDTTRAWSSAAPGYVPASDPAFAAWLAAGNYPSSILSEAELVDVLTLAGFPNRAPIDLVTYANTKQWALATGGMTLTLSGQAVQIATDDDSRTAITGKYLRMAQPGAPAMIAWQVGPNSFVTIAAADFATLAVKVADFVQATFNALQVVLAAIAAGTITTKAGVDAAAWPAAAG